MAWASQEQGWEGYDEADMDIYPMDRDVDTIKFRCQDIREALEESGTELPAVYTTELSQNTLASAFEASRERRGSGWFGQVRFCEIMGELVAVKRMQSDSKGSGGPNHQFSNARYEVSMHQELWLAAGDRLREAMAFPMCVNMSDQKNAYGHLAPAYTAQGLIGAPPGYARQTLLAFLTQWHPWAPSETPPEIVYQMAEKLGQLGGMIAHAGFYHHDLHAENLFIVHNATVVDNPNDPRRNPSKIVLIDDPDSFRFRYYAIDWGLAIVPKVEHNGVCYDNIEDWRQREYGFPVFDRVAGFKWHLTPEQVRKKELPPRTWLQRLRDGDHYRCRRDGVWSLEDIFHYYTDRLPEGTELDEAARERRDAWMRHIMEKMQEHYNKGFVAEYAPNIFPWPS